MSVSSTSWRGAGEWEQARSMGRNHHKMATSRFTVHLLELVTDERTRRKRNCAKSFY